MNPLNPTVEIELGGEVRNLKLDFGSLAAAEAVTGKNYLNVRSLIRLSATELVAVVWGCLLHEDESVTLKQVQGWITYGNSAYVMNKLSEAVNACFPTAEQSDSDGGESPLDPKPSRRSKGSKLSADTTSD